MHNPFVKYYKESWFDANGSLVVHYVPEEGNALGSEGTVNIIPALFAKTAKELLHQEVDGEEIVLRGEVNGRGIVKTVCFEDWWDECLTYDEKQAAMSVIVLMDVFNWFGHNENLLPLPKAEQLSLAKKMVVQWEAKVSELEKEVAA